MQRKRRVNLGITIAAAGLVIALGSVPLVGFGADHLDAPNLTSPSERSDADINDVYVFEGRNDDHTVLAVTTHPAAGAIAPLTYARDVWYRINVDRNGDAEADVQYTATFDRPRDNGRQSYEVWRRDRSGLDRVARGVTGREADVSGGGKVFAGLRSDPFFFDLDAFRGSVLGQGDRTFCDGDEVDFFESLNTNAIVLQVPDRALGRNIGVWAQTIGADEGRIDRKGRPAINTVFNSGEDKNRFNAGMPTTDRRRFGDNVVGVLKTFSGLDAEGAYTNAEARTLMKVLLPDVVTYDTRTDAAGPLNGRALADDVIDAELNLVTGGYPFEGRNGTGAITGDCIDAHTDYLGVFPYLGDPHEA